MATYLPYEPNQPFLLPPSPHEWLPKDHMVYFISDLVDQLDLSAITARYERPDPRGHAAYHPRLMVKILLYAYCQGIYSSRAIERALYEDVGFRVLGAGNYPDHNTISDFRKDHLKAFSQLFLQVLMVCAAAGMVKLGHVALDGTKIKANASKHKAMSYGRMKEEIQRLQREIEAMLDRAEAADRADALRPRGDRVPEELAFREKRIAKIREAMAALESEAKAVSAEDEDPDKTPPDKGNGRGSRKPAPKLPEDRAQRNFTDPESRIMRGPEKQFLQGYNAQVAVDAESQVIVAADVTNQAADAPHLVPMVEQIEQNLGERPNELSADAGYYSDQNVGYLQDCNIEPFIPPGKVRHSDFRLPAPRGRIRKDATARERIARKLRTTRGRQRYKLRQTSVEPVLGQIKDGRGFRQFSLRGLEKVKGEWILICLAHNITKLHRRTQAA